MEAEDIKYVMDEFKKSEESLRNHNRSKVSNRKINEKEKKIDYTKRQVHEEYKQEIVFDCFNPSCSLSGNI